MIEFFKISEDYWDYTVNPIDSRKGVDQSGQAGYLSGSCVVVDSPFLSCLVDDRYGRSQGGLRRFWRTFIDSSPDVLDYLFHPRSV